MGVAGARGLALAGLAVLAVLARPGAARAEGAKPDWARGLVLATGVGVADRQAPSP